MLFALPGVILTTLLVGGVVAAGTGLTIQIAMVFGALISATDPVAVVALFRRLGVPRRLQVLLEGESLFNDGTAIVMFNLMLAIALAGKFSVIDSVRQFLTVSGGGVLVGIALGIVFSRIMGRIDDPLVETTLTTVLAFGSYLIVEYFHVSGVLAVVAAGIVNGNSGPRDMSATTRVVVFNFWEYAAFIANSFIFLLIGLTIDLNFMLGKRAGYPVGDYCRPGGAGCQYLCVFPFWQGNSGQLEACPLLGRVAGSDYTGACTEPA